MSSRRGRTQEPSFYVHPTPYQRGCVPRNFDSKNSDGAFNILEIDGFSGNFVTRPVKSNRGRQKCTPRELYQQDSRSIRLNGWGVTSLSSSGSVTNPVSSPPSLPDGLFVMTDLPSSDLSKSSSSADTTTGLVSSRSPSLISSYRTLLEPRSEPPARPNAVCQSQIDPALLEESNPKPSFAEQAYSSSKPAFQYSHRLLQPIPVHVVHPYSSYLSYEVSAYRNPYQLRPIDPYRRDYF